jgi:hypothetical protein
MALGKTNYPTAHILYKHMKKINNQLKLSYQKSPAYIADMLQPMQEKFDKYWSKMQDLAEINLIFDPRCKLELIEFFLSDANQLSPEATANSIDKKKKNLGLVC